MNCGTPLVCLTFATPFAKARSMVEPDLIFTLLNACGVMALVAICFGQIERLPFNPLARTLLQGLLFGCGAALSMHAAVQLMPGYFVDARSIFVGFAGAFAGWPAALLAMSIAMIMRLFKGGDGIYAAMVALPIAAMAGIGWQQVLGRRPARLPCLAGLGLSVSGTMLVTPFFLPLSQLISITGNMALLVVSNVVLALVLGSFIERERRHIAREARLFVEARSDALTGLPNRRSFERTADRMLAGAAMTSPISLLALDLDHFKDVNDRYGHAFGDEVLKATADTIRQCVGESGSAARIGGEEFAVVLDLPAVAAMQVASNIQRRLDQGRVLFGSTPVGVTISIGLAMFTAPTEFEVAHSRADAALYAAKRHGRNRVELSLMPNGQSLAA